MLTKRTSKLDPLPGSGQIIKDSMKHFSGVQLLYNGVHLKMRINPGYLS